MIDPNKVKKDDILTIVHYVKVASVVPGKKDDTQVSVVDVDSKQLFDINGDPLIKSCLSPDQFDATKKMTRTEVAKLFVRCFNKPMKVCFVKQDGSEREMRCRLVEPDDIFGRSMVEDLDIDNGSPLRKVTHETIKWLIVDGVRYEVKK